MTDPVPGADWESLGSGRLVRALVGDDLLCLRIGEQIEFLRDDGADQGDERDQRQSPLLVAPGSMK